VDSPKHGSHFGGGAAAPIVRNTIKRILNLDDDFYVPPQPPQMPVQQKSPAPYILATAGLLPADTTPGVVPDFRGSSLRKALRLARRAGVRLQMEGSGQVVQQSIKPGSLVDLDEACLITLAPESDSQ
jgi:hypothetical protein